MAEVKKAVELDVEALEEVAGRESSGTYTYSVHCLQCGSEYGCLGTGLSLDDATSIVVAPRTASKGHKAVAVPGK